jgi:hypothetical protein
MPGAVAVSALGAADRSRARMLGVVSSRRPQIGSSGDCSSAADSLICRLGDIGISPKHPYNVRVRIKAMADFSLGVIGKVVVPTQSELVVFEKVVPRIRT